MNEKNATFLKNNKWKLICGVLLLIVISVLVVQCATRTDYGLYVLYAGPQYINNITYTNIASTLSDILTAQDGAAPEVNFSRITYVPPALVKDYESDGIYYNGAANADALTEFANVLAAGEYCVLLIDPFLYDMYSSTGVFVPLRDLGINIDDNSVYDSCAIRLSALGVCNRPGFSDLPDDTLLVFRDFSYIQSLLGNRAKREEKLQLQKDYFKLIVQY